MSLEKPHFDNIVRGLKRHEGRRHDEKREKIRIGDIIRFSDGTRTVEKRVVNIIGFRTVSDMCELYYKELIPGAGNWLQVLTIYQGFNFSPRERALMFVFE